MRENLRTLNFITITFTLVYVIFTHQVYNLLIDKTGHVDTYIYHLSKIPYYLILITIGLYIIGIIKAFIRSRKIKMRITIGIIPSDIIIILLFIATIVLTPPFEFLEHKEKDRSYPITTRYDKLFVCNDFHSNEGDYEGGYGDTKYIYIPISKKMIYISSKGIKVEKVQYKESNKVKIGKKEYTITDTWFVES